MLEEIWHCMEQSSANPSPWKRISLAMEVSECREEEVSPAEVFHRADREMYINKRKMKGKNSLCRDEGSPVLSMNEANG